LFLVQFGVISSILTPLLELPWLGQPCQSGTTLPEEKNIASGQEFRNHLGSLWDSPRSLFDSGINWGRVIALLAFGYLMAVQVWRSGVRGFLRRIAGFVRDFMLHNHIARWIAQQGGWVTPCPGFDPSPGWKSQQGQTQGGCSSSPCSRAQN
uniref:Bcl-2 Bcl-2 homology region 1-3 domain-containing protein n=1 Tax=Zosterops lateralis melanops TaxID=1220523 RepID=A0A8D2PFW0_ZOSLA